MIPCFDVAGNPFEMGVQIGKKAKRFIRPSVNFYQEHWKMLYGKSFNEHLWLIESTIPYTAKLVPKTFDELRGIAQGSGVPFNVLFLVNSIEALGQFNHEHCTSILIDAARTKRQKLLLAHNEDWISFDAGQLYLLRGRPAGEPALLAFTYGAWIPQYGVNANGLAFVADSNTATDVQPGLSQTFVGREVLRCKNIEDAVRRIRSLPRVDGHSYVLATPTEGMIVETTARQTERLTLSIRRPILAHTNFYQGKRTSLLEKEKRVQSRARHARVVALLNDEQELFDEKPLRKILSDHKKLPGSVCTHTTVPFKDATIAQLLIEPATRSIKVVAGNPCQGQSKPVHLSL